MAALKNFVGFRKPSGMDFSGQMGTGNEDGGNEDVGLKYIESWIETFLQPPSLAPGIGPGTSKATFSVDKKII